MPELPEVETVKRDLEASLLGKKIKTVDVIRSDLRVAVPENFAALLTGKICSDLQRRGKYIILHFTNDISAILHLGMSGRIRIEIEENKTALLKHDHIRLTTTDGFEIIFHDPRRFGMFYTSNSSEWQNEKCFAEMGPEPLENWDGSAFFYSLRGRKTPVKIALLDQRIVSGLGNIYVCEALFCAGINPLRLASDVTKPESEKLVTCTRSVLAKAIDAGGSTLRDYKKTDGSLGYFQYQFAVYDQEDQKCPRPKCEGIIKRIIQAGRSTYYCPVCQK